MNPPSAASAPRTVRAQAFGNDLVGAAVLSGVAGYVDTAGFLALCGLFTAHVTGDLVTAGVVVAERLRTGAATRLAMIPIFMLSVAGTALFARRIKRQGREPLTALLTVMTVALALFGTTGVALRRSAVAPDDWGVAIIGATGVVAMAIQNTLMRDALSSFCPTTIMTGNLTQVTIDMVDLLLPPPSEPSFDQATQRRDAKRRLKRFGIPLLGFMLGAALGAVLTHALGLWSIALPTAVVGVLAGVAWQTARVSAPAEANAPASRAAREQLVMIAHEQGSVPANQATSTQAASRDHEGRLSRIRRRQETRPLPRTAGRGESGRHASGTQLMAMQPPTSSAREVPASGTYSKAEAIRAADESPLPNRSAPNRRRAR